MEGIPESVYTFFSKTPNIVFCFLKITFTFGPKNLKKSKTKTLSNEIIQFHVIFVSIFGQYDFNQADYIMENNNTKISFHVFFGLDFFKISWIVYIVIQEVGKYYFFILCFNLQNNNHHQNVESLDFSNFDILTSSLLNVVFLTDHPNATRSNPAEKKLIVKKSSFFQVKFLFGGRP